MAGRSHIVKKLYLLLGLALLFLPMLQKEWGLVREAPLQGAVKEASRPELSWDHWWQDSLQSQAEKFLHDGFGFRPSLVRLNNEIAYRLYRSARAREVVVGRNGWLYEEAYIHALYGEDYVSEEKNRDLARDLARIQQDMARSGKLLVVVLAPSKAYIHPEYIPSRFVRPPDRPTNYRDLAHMLPEEGVLLIDGNKWFRALKDTTRYPLYPKTGIHWSAYGKYLMVDSLARLIEGRTGEDLPDLVWKGIEVRESLDPEDLDIERGMNLLCSIPNIPMPYPGVEIEREGKRVMSHLTIADSYWWGIYGKGIAEKVFGYQEFWYYSVKIHGGPEREPETIVWDLDLPEALADKDLVILMCTEAKLGDVYRRFVQQVERFPDFGDRLYEETLALTMARIRQVDEWMDGVRTQAAERKIPPDSMLMLNAAYHLSTRLLKK